VSDRPPVLIDWRITMPLMFAVFVSSIGLISWALASANHAADALRELSEYKVSSGAEIHDLRVTTDKQIDVLRSASTITIGFGIHLDNLEKWVGHAETREAEAERRLNDIERTQALMTAQLGAITQASMVRLGPRR
jgi:hypothetical protein